MSLSDSVSWYSSRDATASKKDSIFYDIVLKGGGSKDQNQILEQNWNLDKLIHGSRWKDLMLQLKIFNIVLKCTIISQNSILPLDYDIYSSFDL